MKIERFEDILAWKKAKILVEEVYRTSRVLKDFGFRDQLQRAAISVMNNIAEGFERKGNKEFSRFLYISKGSCGEVRSMLYVALELNYIFQEEFDIIYERSVEISRMLAGLIKTLK